MGFTLPDERYPTLEKKAAFLEELLWRTRAMQGVSQAGIVACFPARGISLTTLSRSKARHRFRRGNFATR